MKSGVKILCVLMFFGVVIPTVYFLEIYPNMSLGYEGDAKLYHNHILSLETGMEYTGIYDNYVNITVNGKEYTNLSIANRISYGLIAESEDTQEIQQSDITHQSYEHEFFCRDIGKKMGVVEQSNYTLLKDLQVFYYAEYPEDDNICILKLEDGYGYQFYIARDIKIY